MSQPIVITYLVYLTLSICLTVWVAHTLHKNGRVFLLDVFEGNAALADSINHLLVVGFYLVNLGFVCLALKTRYPVGDARESIELLSWKMGTVLLVLGAMHLLNVRIFSVMRRRAVERPHPPRLPGVRQAPVQAGG